jgi:hypothetical protein
MEKVAKTSRGEMARQFLSGVKEFRHLQGDGFHRLPPSGKGNTFCF